MGHSLHGLLHVLAVAGNAKGQLSLRIDQGELDAWKAEARSQGLSLTELVRLRMSGDQSGGWSEQLRLMVAAQVQSELERQAAGFADQVLKNDSLIDLLVARVEQRQGASASTGDYVREPVYE